MIIGISGKIGSGKDTAMEMLQAMIAEDGGSQYTEKRFATPLKEFVARILGVSIEKLNDQEFKKSTLGPEWAYLVPVANSILPGHLFPRMHKQAMTVREFMIRLGNGMREVVHPDIWVNTLFAGYIDSNLRWIIPDVRYLNEKDRIEKLCGYVIRIDRPGIPTIDNESETQLDEVKFQYHIINNGTLDDLRSNIKFAYNDIKQRIANPVGI